MQILLRGCWLHLNPRRLCHVAFASSVLSQSSGGWSIAVTQMPSALALRLNNKKRSFAELHYVRHVGKSCAPIVVTDDGFDDNRRSRTVLVNASAAANACAELREFRRQFGTRSISGCLCFAARSAASSIGARGSRLIGGMHHGICRCIAGQGNLTSIHLFVQSRQLSSVVRSEIGLVLSVACNRRGRPAENHPSREFLKALLPK